MFAAVACGQGHVFTILPESGVLHVRRSVCTQCAPTFALSWQNRTANIASMQARALLQLVQIMLALTHE